MKFNPKLKYPKTTLSFGVLIICASVFSFFYDQTINQNQLIAISGTLEKKPYLDHYQIKGGHYYNFDFNLIEYPCTFRISDWEYRSLNLTSIENRIKPGDKISLYILLEDKENIQFAIEKVKTYGISKRNNRMYDLEFRNQHYKDDSWFALFFVGIGIIVCLYALVKNIYTVHGLAIAYAFLCVLFEFLILMP